VLSYDPSVTYMWIRSASFLLMAILVPLMPSITLSPMEDTIVTLPPGTSPRLSRKRLVSSLPAILLTQPSIPGDKKLIGIQIPPI
jgi:hypothetical protein